MLVYLGDSKVKQDFIQVWEWIVKEKKLKTSYKRGPQENFEWKKTFWAYLCILVNSKNRPRRPKKGETG